MGLADSHQDVNLVCASWGIWGGALLIYGEGGTVMRELCSYGDSRVQTWLSQGSSPYLLSSGLNLSRLPWGGSHGDWFWDLCHHWSSQSYQRRSSRAWLTLWGWHRIQLVNKNWDVRPRYWGGWRVTTAWLCQRWRYFVFCTRLQSTPEFYLSKSW